MEFILISKLKDKSINKKVVNKKKIATTQLSSFFLLLVLYFISNLSSLSTQLQIPPITKKDIRLAIYTAIPYFTEGIDDLPLIV